MKYLSKILLASLLVGIMIACDSGINPIEANQKWQYADASKTNVKFINAYTSTIPAGAPGVSVTRFYVYQDAAKLNGNALATAGAWPGPTTYASLKPSSTFHFILDRRVGNDYGKPAKGDTLISTKADLTAGKYSSLFLIGEYPTHTAMLVPDELINPAEGKYAVRFANLVVSATAAKPVDIYSRREKKNLASNLAYKGVTSFIEVPIATIGDTLDVRAANTTVNLYSFNNFNPTSRRSYTFYTYGRVNGGTAFVERLNSYTNR